MQPADGSSSPLIQYLGCEQDAEGVALPGERWQYWCTGSIDVPIFPGVRFWVKPTATLTPAEIWNFFTLPALTGI